MNCNFCSKAGKLDREDIEGDEVVVRRICRARAGLAICHFDSGGASSRIARREARRVDSCSVFEGFDVG